MAATTGNCAFTPRRHSFSLDRLRLMTNLYPRRSASAMTIAITTRLIACDPSTVGNHAHPHSAALKNDIQTQIVIKRRSQDRRRLRETPVNNAIEIGIAIEIVAAINLCGSDSKLMTMANVNT